MRNAVRKSLFLAPAKGSRYPLPTSRKISLVWFGLVWYAPQIWRNAHNRTIGVTRVAWPSLWGRTPPPPELPPSHHLSILTGFPCIPGVELPGSCHDYLAATLLKVHAGALTWSISCRIIGGKKITGFLLGKRRCLVMMSSWGVHLLTLFCTHWTMNIWFWEFDSEK